MNDSEHLQYLKKQETLSPDERDAILHRVKGFMSMHPVPVPAYVRIFDSFMSAPAYVVGTLRGFQTRAALAGALVVILATTGVGTSYAAENSLPGDLLYGIKVNIQEPLKGAFAATPTEQADWNTQLANNRLQEAEALAAQGKLSAQNAANLTAGLDKATNGFDAAVSEIAATSTPDSVDVLSQVQSSMQATLEVHSEVLDQISSIVPDSKTALASLLHRVRARTIALQESSGDIRQALASSQATSTEVSAVAQLTDAQDTLSSARALVQQASTTSAVATDTVQALQDIRSGDESLQKKNYGAAFVKFQSAAYDAQKAQLRAEAAESLKSYTGISLPATTTPSDQGTDNLNSSLDATSSVSAIQPQ